MIVSSRLNKKNSSVFLIKFMLILNVALFSFSSTAFSLGCKDQFPDASGTYWMGAKCDWGCGVTENVKDTKAVTQIVNLAESDCMVKQDSDDCMADRFRIARCFVCIDKGCANQVGLGHKYPREKILLQKKVEKKNKLS